MTNGQTKTQRREKQTRCDMEKKVRATLPAFLPIRSHGKSDRLCTVPNTHTIPTRLKLCCLAVAPIPASSGSSNNRIWIKSIVPLPTPKPERHQHPVRTRLPKRKTWDGTGSTSTRAFAEEHGRLWGQGVDGWSDFAPSRSVRRLDMGAAAWDCQSGGFAKISRTYMRFLGVWNLVLTSEVLRRGDLENYWGEQIGGVCLSVILGRVQILV